MATRGIAHTVEFIVWDTANNVGKTGDNANLTLRWGKDGTNAAPTNASSEVDSTNKPGCYKLTLTSSETDCNVGVLGGKSSTANVVVIPTKIEFERLPDAAHDAAGGVRDVARINGVVTSSVTTVKPVIGFTTADTITALGNNTITAASIAADAITAAKIADGAIDRATFAADTGLQSIRSNTAQAGAGSSITLDASASSVAGFYTYCLVYITGGTGAGQYRLITDYNGTTKVASITPSWATTPDSTSTFAIVPRGISDVEMVGGNASSPGNINTVFSTDFAFNYDPTSKIWHTNVKQISSDATAADNLEAALDGTGGVTITAGLTGNITGNLSGSVGSVTGNVGGNVVGSVGSISGVTFPSNFAALGINASGHVSRVTLVDTTTTNTDMITAAGIRTAVGLASANLDTQIDAIPTAAENAAGLLDLAAGVETGLTLRQAMRLIAAAAAGKLSGAATTTIVIRNAVADSKDRITATVDASGNRSAITLDLT